MKLDDDSQIRTLFRTPVQYRPSLRAEQIRQIRAHQPARRPILWAAATVIIVGATAAVTWQSWPTNTPAHPAATESPVVTHVNMPVGMTAELSDSMRLELREGCLFAASHVVVWPASANWDAKSRTVSFEQDGVREIRVADTFPIGLGGGLMPLDLVARYLSPEDLAHAESCMPTRSDDLLVVN
jgi:hypothetical protein